MIVKCIDNNKKYLPEDCESPSSDSDRDFHLKVNQTYVVYGITVLDGYPWYYIVDTNDKPFPELFPAPLFEVIDNRLSKYWEFFQQKGMRHKFLRSLFAFPEWGEDPDFHEKLLENYQREVQIFIKYKKLMDLEFPC